MPRSSLESSLEYDAHSDDPSMAFAISRLTAADYLNQSPIGIFRQVQRPTYDDQAREQVAAAVDEVGAGGTADRSARLASLIAPRLGTNADMDTLVAAMPVLKPLDIEAVATALANTPNRGSNIESRALT